MRKERKQIVQMAARFQREHPQDLRKNMFKSKSTEFTIRNWLDDYATDTNPIRVPFKNWKLIKPVIEDEEDSDISEFLEFRYIDPKCLPFEFENVQDESTAREYIPYRRQSS